MVAAIERGVYMRTNCSWSIDDSRNKFQFGCEWGQLIENGKLGPPIREFTVAGNLHQMLMDISIVGADLDPYRSVSSPTLLVRELSIGGSSEYQGGAENA